MSRRKKTPPPSFATRGDWHTHHVILFDDLLDSPAFIALSAHSKEAYIILMQEYKGNYTGPDVICPYKTFQEKGMRPNTLSRALLELEVFGFITCDRGGLQHQPNVYHLVDEWKKVLTKEDVALRKQTVKDVIDLKSDAKKNAKENAELLEAV